MSRTVTADSPAGVGSPDTRHRPRIRTQPRFPSWAAKLVMAVTGLLFVAFVLFHMVGNLKVYTGAEHFDSYAHWLRTLLYPLVPNEGVLWALRVVLVLALIAHVGCALLLLRRSRASAGRDKGRGRGGASAFGARMMLPTGIVLLLFVVVHVLDLTTGTRPVSPEGFRSGSAYANLIASFSRPWMAAVYGITMLVLSLHVAHGTLLAVQDIGGTGATLRRIAAAVGGIAALALLLGNASIPLSVQMGWLS